VTAADAKIMTGGAAEEPDRSGWCPSLRRSSASVELSRAAGGPRGHATGERNAELDETDAVPYLTKSITLQEAQMNTVTAPAETVEVLLPVPRDAATAFAGVGASRSVAGARVSIVNNGWGSSDDLAPVLERVLREEYGVAEVTHFRNLGRGAEIGSGRLDPAKQARGASPAFVREVAHAGDVVLTMLGN
jgi:hypothetical protein